jgi:hypothetical protein
VRLTDVLDASPRSIVTSNTVIFHKNADGTYDNEDGARGRDRFGTFAARINLQEPGWEFTAKWTGKQMEDGDVIPVSCVLGAVYASSTEHWKNIRGLWGLRGYGYDEPMMSIKTWLSGGRCLLIKNWGVGHLYRKKHPYPVSSVNTVYNALLLIALFSPESEREAYFSHYATRCPDTCPPALKEYRKMEDEIREHRRQLERVFVHDFNDFLTINEKVT